MTFTVTITLTNYLDTPARITVRDQLPQPMHGMIQVSVENVLPEPVNRDERNILKWVVTVTPQETSTITFTCVIQHPQEMTLVTLR